MCKLFCLVVGSISLALGLIGVVLPILPTVPFIMLAMICFARASTKVSEYFLSKPFIQKTLNKQLTRKERMKVMAILGFWFLVAGLMMGAHLLLVLMIVWIFHLLYFFIYFEKAKN